MRTHPPSLLSLAIDSALLHISSYSDLSFLPEHILHDLFLRTLRAGKLNEKILKLFIATGKEEILSLIDAFNIQRVLTPVLPTTSTYCKRHSPLLKATKPVLAFAYSSLEKMSQVSVRDDEIDIVIAAIEPDLTSFLEEWRAVFSRFHLIIIKDPDVKGELKIPGGFNYDTYKKADIQQIIGPSNAVTFSGYSCRYFGYLLSKKKYIISIDDDCIPAKDNEGIQVDAIAQHINNLSTPATPFFFNTLYDPFCKGADFVRGYPFSLRSGVSCALSCGLWLNLADLDAPTQALKPELRNTRYVDAVLTVPVKAMMPLSGINIAFDRELVGPALLPSFRLAKEGKFRWETVEDVWTGMCVKVVCDHLGYGVKTGLPYVWRKERGDAIESLKKEWEGVKLMEEVVPFFQSMRLTPAAKTAEDCVIEIAAAVKEQLGRIDPVFIHAADSMVEWVQLWKTVKTRT